MNKSSILGCVALLVLASGVACGSGNVGNEGSKVPSGPEGHVGLTINVVNNVHTKQVKNRFNPDIAIGGGGENLDTVSYTLTNGTNTYSSTANITSNPAFIIGSVGVGTNYGVTVTGTTVDGKVTCTGSTILPQKFAVTANALTSTAVTVNCTEAVATDAGDVAVTVTAQACDTLNFMTPLLSTIPRGGSTTVVMNGTGFGIDPVTFFVQGAFGQIGNSTTVPVTGLGGATITNIDPNNASFTFNCPAGNAENDRYNGTASDGANPPCGASVMLNIVCQ
jgi:hypothetical protein